jgi:hypothetical protein
MIGEGYDCPGIEAVILHRRTSSYILYKQQIGRALRICEGKYIATIVDLVGNVQKHGLPNRSVDWSFDSNDQQLFQKQNLIVCKKCSHYVYAYDEFCKNCGTEICFRAGTGLGGGQREALYLDYELIKLKIRERELQRQEEYRALDDARFERLLHEKIVFPEDLLKNAMLSKIVNSFASSLSGHFPTYDINMFLRHEQIRDLSFWMTKIVYRELDTPNVDKFKKIFLDTIAQDDKADTRECSRPAA